MPDDVPALTIDDAIAEVVKGAVGRRVKAERTPCNGERRSILALHQDIYKNRSMSVRLFGNTGSAGCRDGSVTDSVKSESEREEAVRKCREMQRDSTGATRFLEIKAKVDFIYGSLAVNDSRTRCIRGDIKNF